MIEAQIADKYVIDAKDSKNFDQRAFDEALKKLDLAIKRVQRRFASIKTGRVRWFDGQNGYVRPRGAEFCSAEVLHTFTEGAIDKNTEVVCKFEYWGPNIPIQCIIEQKKK